MTQDDLFAWKNRNRGITGEVLPEIAADHIVLIWDQDLATHEIVIRFGEREIHRESADWEYYDYFMESCKTLRRKYGNRLYDVVPTERTYQSLWGDKLSAPEMIEEFRKRLRMASRIEDWAHAGEMVKDRWSDADFDVSEYDDEEEEEEPEEEPDPEAEEEAARLRVRDLLCALRDRYNYGTIVPILADPEKLRHAMQTATQQWERDEMEEEDYAHESWGDLNRSDQEKIIAMARELWGEVVAGAFPALHEEDPETRKISDLTDDEFRDFIDRDSMK